MQRNGEPLRFRFLTWDEFECAAMVIAAKCGADRQLIRPDSVFGFPRGGLPLAVLISHRLNIPMRDYIGPGTLVVDDVYETGRTFEPLANHPPHLKWVWAVKDRAAPINFVKAFDAGQWLVFPWESADFAGVDAEGYYASRQRDFPNDPRRGPLHRDTVSVRPVAGV